jgi:hypothetical protein
MRLKFLCSVVGALLLAGLVPVAASAITVNLRVEGSTGTLFEGPVTTGGESVTTPSSPTAEPCDVKDNGSNGGFGTSYGTPTTALYDAAKLAGLTFDAQWFNSFDDFEVSQVGTDVNDPNPPYESWGYAVNFTTAGVGGCQFQLAPNSNVLWAYNYFNAAHLLELTGPSSVNLNAPFLVNVTDAQTGLPIQGATIGSATTDANGNAAITLGNIGTDTLKANRSDSVRSNGLVVCVHNGNDGNCGTIVPPSTGVTGSGASSVLPPPLVQSLSIRDDAHFAARHAPTTLGGSFAADPAGIVQVYARIERTANGRCQVLGTSRFGSARCGIVYAPWVKVGNGTPFSYQLPVRLAAGHYVVQVEGVDGAGHRETNLQRGLNWLVFDVG